MHQGVHGDETLCACVALEVVGSIHGGDVIAINYSIAQSTLA